MKIPSPSQQIKRGAVAGMLFTLVSGCAAQVAEAPFFARSDTVMPGALVGPFDGRVIDAQSGKPVAGALVYADWGFEVGRGRVAPAGAATHTVETNVDGRYHIDPLAERPSGQRRVARFTLIVYKRGYVAYRSDRRFESLSART